MKTDKHNTVLPYKVDRSIQAIYSLRTFQHTKDLRHPGGLVHFWCYTKPSYSFPVQEDVHLSISSHDSGFRLAVQSRSRYFVL